MPHARGRRILGTFQITIPVRAKEDMLDREERLLANLRWIQKAIPTGNRWFPVFGRYVRQIAARVDALGGDSERVAASPSDEWREAYRRCRPGVCQRLRALIAGAGLGTLALALLAVFGLSAPQLLPVLLAGAGIAIVAAIVAWRKGCF